MFEELLEERQLCMAGIPVNTDEVVKMKEMDVKKPMGPECVRMDHEGMC